MNHLSPKDKEAAYENLIPQLQAVISNEDDLIANMANVCAMLKSRFDWLWVGFYRVDSDANQLVLGPFQGPLACTRIPYGKGVCGEVWQHGEAQTVDDVLMHPNHIACSSLSRSEIVIPLTDSNKQIIAVFDIDAETTACFDDTDLQYLSTIANDLTSKH